jgi:hypothetical protein
MRHSKITVYLAGCIGVLTVGAALAKKPAETAATAFPTPAGCTDSQRGRTHVLRFCGDKHYWIMVAAPRSPWPEGAPGGGWAAGNAAVSGLDVVSSAGLNGASR